MIVSHSHLARFPRPLSPQVFAPYLDDPFNFFVISSDFCHWGARFRFQPYDASLGEVHEYVAWLDRRAMDCIEGGEPADFARYLSETRNTICGRHPIALLLEACKHTRTQLQIHFEKYAQSTRVTSTYGSSVSYASAAATVVVRP